MKTIICLIAVWILAGASNILHGEDMTLQGEFVALDITSEATLFLSSEGMRLNSGSRDVFSLWKEQRVVTLNHRERSFSITYFDEIQKLTSEQDQMVKNMGSVQRQLLEMFAGGSLEEITLTDSGPKGKIAGHRTQKYLLKWPPWIEIEIRSAPELEVPSLFYDVLKVWRTDRPIELKGDSDASSNNLYPSYPLMERQKQTKGLLLKYVEKMKMLGTQFKTTLEFKKIVKGPIRASVFEIPTGYQELSSHTIQ